jgi:hypothetical protein
MTKIVVCVSYYTGGFRLSQEAIAAIEARKGEPVLYEGELLDRHDPDLIAVVEELGERANGDFVELRIEQIPGNQYNLLTYDGVETVITPETYGWITA